MPAKINGQDIEMLLTFEQGYPDILSLTKIRFPDKPVIKNGDVLEITYSYTISDD